MGSKNQSAGHGGEELIAGLFGIAICGAAALWLVHQVTDHAALLIPLAGGLVIGIVVALIWRHLGAALHHAAATTLIGLLALTIAIAAGTTAGLADVDNQLAAQDHYTGLLSTAPLHIHARGHKPPAAGLHAPATASAFSDPGDQLAIGLPLAVLIAGLGAAIRPLPRRSRDANIQQPQQGLTVRNVE